MSWNLCVTLTIMYLAIDVGGTKTLVAVFDETGKLIEQNKFPTPEDYEDFFPDLQKIVAGFTTKTFLAAAAGIPASELDREHGIGVSFGNLAWQNVAFKSDLAALIKAPVTVENDAKAAALYEAVSVKDDYKRVLYITIGTGIGTAFVNNGIIDIAFGDGGGRTLLVEHEGKQMPWEDLASGKAIVTRFGKRAAYIEGNKTWQTIAEDLTLGLIPLIHELSPDVIIIGGGVGVYLPRYQKPLEAALKQQGISLLIREAVRPEEAVVYGCYELAKAAYGTAR